MKKIISMLLVVLFLLLFVACESKNNKNNTNTNDVKVENTQDKSIELTLENYLDFLNFEATVSAHTTETWSFNESKPSDSRITTYNGADCSVEITGKSHYKYNEVYLDIKLEHYTILQKQRILNGEFNVKPFSSQTITVKLNLAGNGTRECTLSTVGSDWKKYDQISVIDAMAYQDIETITENTTCTVIAVRGSVTEY